LYSFFGAENYPQFSIRSAQRAFILVRPAGIAVRRLYGIPVMPECRLLPLSPEP
jgi:hypothetical protein